MLEVGPNVVSVECSVNLNFLQVVARQCVEAVHSLNELQ